MNSTRDTKHKDHHTIGAQNTNQIPENGLVSSGVDLVGY